jgi:hypothetical protein
VHEGSQPSLALWGDYFDTVFNFTVHIMVLNCHVHCKIEYSIKSKQHEVQVTVCCKIHKMHVTVQNRHMHFMNFTLILYSILQRI